jgi:tyrosyl-tRNA synthetase
VVVTGATNMKPGDLVPYLGEGNVVPGYLILKGEKVVLEKRMLRGIESDSMILAEDEIGLSEDHEGILILTDQIKNHKLKITNDDELVGMSFVDTVSEEVLEKIYKTAGVVEITPELQKRIDLIMSVAKYGGEVVGADELPGILSSGETLVTYDGFEPSGQMHIAQGIIRAINTNKMIEAGFHFIMWVADWFGYLNNKMGGDMEKIQEVGRYFIEIWRASGMDLENTEFLWTSDFVGQKEYWETVMKVAKTTTLNRILRTTEIMGRSESDNLLAAQIIYPCMQVTDIFKVMKCQVTQLGMDQRKVNMLARQVGPELGFWKPVVVSHGMLQGLGKPAPKDADPVTRAISMKMSKSKPETAIFMTDTEEDVKRKIINAYCPPSVVEDNPILDYCKQIIFEAHHLKGQENLLKEGFIINREEKFGGNVTYKTYEELEADYAKGDLFPLDLKNAVIFYINELLKPVRKHFEENQEAKELLERVKSYQVTR